MDKDAQDTVLSWLGLAIAVVVLNDFGLGKQARYVLLAVILYDLLTNVEKIGGLFGQWQAGVARTGAPFYGRSSSGHF